MRIPPCPHLCFTAAYISLLHTYHCCIHITVATCATQGDEKQSKVTKLSKNEVLMLNIGSMCTGARVLAVCCVYGECCVYGFYVVYWCSCTCGMLRMGYMLSTGYMLCMGYMLCGCVHIDIIIIMVTCAYSLFALVCTPGALVHTPTYLPTYPPTQVKHDLAKLQLTSPVCTKEGEKVALSRRIDKHWRLIGWGQIQKGLRMDLPGRA